MTTNTVFARLTALSLLFSLSACAEVQLCLDELETFPALEGTESILSVDGVLLARTEEGVFARDDDGWSLELAVAGTDGFVMAETEAGRRACIVTQRHEPPLFYILTCRGRDGWEEVPAEVLWSRPVHTWRYWDVRDEPSPYWYVSGHRVPYTDGRIDSPPARVTAPEVLPGDGQLDPVWVVDGKLAAWTERTTDCIRRGPSAFDAATAGWGFDVDDGCATYRREVVVNIAREGQPMRLRLSSEATMTFRGAATETREGDLLMLIREEGESRIVRLPVDVL